MPTHRRTPQIHHLDTPRPASSAKLPSHWPRIPAYDGFPQKRGVGDVATRQPNLCGTRYRGLADRSFIMVVEWRVWRSVGVRVRLMRIDDVLRVSVQGATAGEARVVPQDRQTHVGLVAEAVELALDFRRARCVHAMSR